MCLQVGGCVKQFSRGGCAAAASLLSERALYLINPSSIHLYPILFPTSNASSRWVASSSPRSCAATLARSASTSALSDSACAFIVFFWGGVVCVDGWGCLSVRGQCCDMYIYTCTHTHLYIYIVHTQHYLNAHLLTSWSGSTSSLARTSVESCALLFLMSKCVR